MFFLTILGVQAGYWQVLAGKKLIGITQRFTITTNISVTDGHPLELP